MTLVQISVLHKKSIHIMLQIATWGCLIEADCVSKLLDVQFNLASSTRPGIRVILDVYGLKIVTRSKRRTALEGGRKETDHAWDNPPHSGLCVWSPIAMCRAGSHKPCQRCY